MSGDSKKEAERKLIASAKKMNSSQCFGSKQSAQVTPKGIKRMRAKSRARRRHIDAMNAEMDRLTGGPIVTVRSGSES